MEKKLSHVAIPSSEITPEATYISRRDFIKAMGFATAGALLTACTPKLAPSLTQVVEQVPGTISANTDELGSPVNTYQDITNYNNYYEFTDNKQGVAKLAQAFHPKLWTVEVGGLVQNPRTFGLEELLKFEQKERVYRLRCVEAWSMVIPWTGFELTELLNQVEPLGSAKYVGFTTVLRPEEMPGQKSPFYPWPYTEGLRLDEAMQRLTILATGLYGKDLPNQDGAPIRLVVPWKYGFKSIKAIVRIDLLAEQPSTLWTTVSPGEYGFYANVNPQVDHPRWSQRTERRIGELGRRDTLLFNGYGDEVASLYANMDLKVNY